MPLHIEKLVAYCDRRINEGKFIVGHYYAEKKRLIEDNQPRLV